MIAPGKPRSNSRITGPDRGEKLRVGSSRISTFRCSMLIFSSSNLAFWPPERSRMVWSISCIVYFMLPRYVRMRVFSSLSQVLDRYSTGV